jgi:uncharacterized delta-60 repeat protein
MMTRAVRIGALGAAIIAALAVSAPRAGAVQRPTSDRTDEAHALVVQPDGHIVVVGRSLNGTGMGDWVTALVRYRPDGALDAAFGRGGQVVAAIGPAGSEAYAAALQADGRIVVAGRAFLRAAPPHNTVFAVARFNPDGSSDTTFGAGGAVTTAIGTDATARAVAVQVDGRIVVAGVATLAGDDDFALVRYLPDGSLDPQFGEGGVRTLDVGGGTKDGARALILQADGHIVLGGSAESGRGTVFALARLTPDGERDETFGTVGVVVTSLDRVRASEAHALAPLPDGRIVAGGFTNDGFGKRFALVRYLPDGSLDPRFGGGGAATAQFCSACFNDVVQGLALQADGGIIAVGHSARAGGFRMVFARFGLDGRLDPTFGGSGLVTADAGGRDNWANAVAVQDDGRILAVGVADPAGRGDFAVVRLDPTGGLDAGFGGGIVVTDISREA